MAYKKINKIKKNKTTFMVVAVIVVMLLLGGTAASVYAARLPENMAEAEENHGVSEGSPVDGVGGTSTDGAGGTSTDGVGGTSTDGEGGSSTDGGRGSSTDGEGGSSTDGVDEEISRLVGEMEVKLEEMLAAKTDDESFETARNEFEEIILLIQERLDNKVDSSTLDELKSFFLLRIELLQTLVEKKAEGGEFDAAVQELDDGMAALNKLVDEMASSNELDEARDDLEEMIENLRSVVETKAGSDELLYTSENMLAILGGLQSADENFGLLLDDLEEKFEELKKYVGDGKSSVASAITMNGVTTETDASFATLADNVGRLAVLKYNDGVADTKVGTALASSVLAGTTFTNSEGVGIDGTMPDYGVLDWNPTVSDTYTIQPGYYSGGTLSTEAAYDAGKSDYKENLSTSGTVCHKLGNTRWITVSTASIEECGNCFYVTTVSVPEGATILGICAQHTYLSVLNNGHRLNVAKYVINGNRVDVYGREDDWDEDANGAYRQHAMAPCVLYVE